VSVDEAADSRNLAEDRRIRFPLLSDPDRQVMTQYGVSDAEREIAVPAIFIIARDGTVFWKHVGEYIVDRPSADKLLSLLDELKAKEKKTE
jgi:peroxiredoxin